MLTKLIPAADIHLHTDVEKNVGLQLLEPRIVRAQEKHLVPVIGPVLYELVGEALAAEQASPSTPMPDRLDVLHTQLLPMLAQWVYYLSLPHLNVRTSNRGLDSSDQGVSPQAYNTLAKAIQTEAEDRTNDLQKWIDARRVDYPEAPSLTPKRRRTGGIVL